MWSAEIRLVIKKKKTKPIEIYIWVDCDGITINWELLRINIHCEHIERTKWLKPQLEKVVPVNIDVNSYFDIES